MYYNVKIYNYVGGQQIRLYKNVIGKDEKKKKIIKCEKEKEVIEQIEMDLQKQEVKESKSYLEKLEEKEIKKNNSIRNSVNRSINHVYSLARSCEWDYFVTMTFAPNKVDRFDYNACVTKMSNWLKNYGRGNKDFKYLIVPEQHKDGAWHFHGLFANGNYSSFVDSGKKSKGDPIYNIGQFKFGFTTATKVKDTLKVSSYICKYITKDTYKNIPNGKKRYWVSRNIKVSEIAVFMEDKQKQNLKKSDELSYISKVKNDFNEIEYLEFNYMENKVSKEIISQQAYDYACSLFGKEIVVRK